MPEKNKSTPPKSNPPKSISIDRDAISGETSIKIKPKTAGTIVVALFGCAGAWTVFTANLAHKSDISSHDANEHAHPIILKSAQGATTRSIVEVVTRNAQAVDEMPNKLDEVKRQADATAQVVGEVQRDFHEQRAEIIAQRAVDQMPKRTSRRQLARRYQEVKRKAMQNLQNDLPVNTGLESITY